ARVDAARAAPARERGLVDRDLPAFAGRGVESQAAGWRGAARAHERDAVRGGAAPLRGQPAGGTDRLAVGTARPRGGPGARGPARAALRALDARAARRGRCALALGAPR